MDIFLLILLGVWALIIGAIGIFAAEKDFYRIIFYLILFVGTAMIAIIPSKVKTNTEEETAIECLKGNNPYKMEIQYELRDSIYIPVDTIYIKIVR